MWKNFTDAFYLNFISDDRWHYIADGLKTTLIITFFACMMGIVLGFIVGMIRSTHDKTGKLINQVTKGNWEVTNYYGFDEKTKTIFYQSVENGSINRDIYRIGLDGKNKVRLSSKVGTSAATFSPNFQYFITTFSSATQPPVYSRPPGRFGSVAALSQHPVFYAAASHRNRYCWS